MLNPPNKPTPYDHIADQWDAARTTLLPNERRYLDLLLTNLPEASTILDLGCGTARPIAEYITSHGHHIVGVDRSNELLARARERLPDEEFIHADIEHFTPERTFAAAVCWDALFHVERSLHEKIIQRVAGCLIEGGTFMLSTGGSEHPAFTDTMFGHEFYYDSNAPEATQAIVKRAGFKVLLAEFANQPTGGRDKGKFAIVASKR